MANLTSTVLVRTKANILAIIYEMFLLNKVQTALRYYATGCLFNDDAEMHGISKASVSRIVTKVTQYIAGLESQHIQFPTA